MTKRLLVGAALFAATLLPACGSQVQPRGKTTPLEIIPIPREVQRAPDQTLGAAILVLPSNRSEKARIAAEEINLRLKDLGASPLAIATAGSAEARAFQGRRIELSIAPSGQASKAPDVEQGYWIDSRDEKRVRLVGGDEQGLLWAAITFRRMLVRGEQGQAVLLSAEIRDWPDFAMRMMNRFYKYHREHTERGLLNAIQKGGEEAQHYAQGYVADGRRTVEFLVRLKLNMTWLPTYGIPNRFDTLSKRIGGDGRAERFLATLKRVTDYARARGMAVCSIQMTHIGASPADDDDPQISRCVLHRSHKRYFCWSLDDHNRRKAEHTAHYFAKAGYTMVTLHNVDGGGYSDPAYWSRRCKHCQARWGDDRGAADAHLYALWNEAFKKHAPNVIFAAIQYPYNASIVLQEDNPDHERIRDYWASLHKHLPQDPHFSVCVRENVRPAIAAFYEIFDTRPVLVYWMTDTMPGDHRWAPIFTSRVRFAKTFKQAGRRDWIFAYSSSCRPLTAVAGAQYLWNADSPGAALWPGGIDIDRDGTQPAAFFDGMLPKFVAELFGERAAPDLLDVFKGCISPSYCMLPGDVARMCRTPNTADRMQQQYEALVRACGGLERVWQRIELGKKDVLRRRAEPYFYGLTEQVGRARLWASFHLATMRASEALRRGEPEPKIAAELEAASQRVRADAAIAERMSARVKKKPKSGKADTNRWLRKRINARYYETDQDALLTQLQRLRDVVNGRSVELRESHANAPTVRHLLPDDGRGVVLRGKGATKLSLVSYPTQGGSETAIQIEGLTQPWHDGLSVGFPAVDIEGYVEDGGVLRFYINGGGAGNQQFTFWLYARNPNGEVTKTDVKGWRWVALADYVAIDDLEATWQLVSIPLGRLLRKGYTKVAGFGMNNAVYNEVCGPVWIDSMYVAMNRVPIEHEVAVQAPPEQPPATEARPVAVGVQPTIFVGASGMESRVMLGLKLEGNGALTNVRIALRFVRPDGEVVRSEPVLSAAKLRTPWWSPSLRFDLGPLVSKRRIEIVLTSNEVRKRTTAVVRW